MAQSQATFPEMITENDGKKTYKHILTAVENEKGVLDVDTVKGCSSGMNAHSNGGCYSECYANKIASRYGIDFTISVSRKLTLDNYGDVFFIVKNYYASWYRIGTSGDPSLDWENTISVCEALRGTGKIPVIITKHWKTLTDYASEIRQNQVDANNKICSEFNERVKWVQSDSSTHKPEGMFDLVFTCPPYYKVEHYVDYDGMPPEGELNSFGTYEEFRDLLFTGYKKAIESLNDNAFFVVMTGDSRDKNGAYHCHEAETVVFFKENGLSVYNQIVYVECEFTRLAHAKKTLHTRKFPKREQKIIVAYKGKISDIKDNFSPIGRL
jgi:hypothetical protein